MDKATFETPDGFSPGSTEGPISQQQQLRLLHNRLMAVYAYAIEGVSAGTPRPWAEKVRAGWRYLRTLSLEDNASLRYKRGPVTRALVEAHVKAKLGELRAAYVQIEQSVLDTDTTGSFRRWLRDTQDSLARFSATFTAMSFYRRMITALWPLAIALAAVGTVWHTILGYAGKSGLLSNWYLVVVSVITYAGGGLAFAAGSKRKFFLKPISISPAWVSNSANGSGHGTITAKNVYEVEDELFSCIGRSKRCERPLDAYLLGAIFLAGAISPLMDIGHQHGMFLPIGYIAIVSTSIAGIIAIRVGIKRTLR